jgi:putative GTP pyrophosphokinase
VDRRRSTEDWGSLYEDLRPLYEAFAERVLGLLETLLDDDDLRYWHSYSWTDSVSKFESALDRARRAGRQVDDPFHDLVEYAGASFVCWSRDQLQPIAEIVEREFDVDYSASLPLSAVREELERVRRQEEPELGYPHAFYVVALDESRRSLPEWRAYADLRLAVHVLTISQYTWWSLEEGHLPYYRASSFPPASREAFSRVADLLATVDDVLEREEAESEEIVARYEEAIDTADLDLPLDATCLEVYLRRAPVVRDLVDIAEAAGMRHDDDEGTGPFALEQELLWLLGRQGLGTLAELDDLLARALDRAPSIYDDICRISLERDFLPYAVRSDLVVFLLVVLGREDADAIELLDLNGDIRAALNTLIGNPVLRDADGDDQ